MVKMPHWPIPHGYKVIDLQLVRVKTLLKLLGNPQNDLPKVIHIAGTNGKGSVLAYLKSILEESGYTIHRYTSPHLVRFNERITLAGEEISDQDLYKFIEECRIASESFPELNCTFFEATTAMALLAFSRTYADLVLLETGMGGRLDATNVIANPALTIITPISYDHTEHLGNTLAAIAREKAGIIKPHCPCVISWQYKEAMEVLIEHCEAVNAPYLAYGKHWDIEIYDNKLSVRFIDNNAFSNDLVKEHNLYIPGLHGIHQFLNAATAVVASSVLLNEYNDISYLTTYQGLLKAKWPARMQRITAGVLYEMLPSDNWELWLDGAHNIAGAEMIIASMSQLQPDLPLFMIHGRTLNRDIKSFLQFFLGKLVLLCCVGVKSEPLSEKASKIKEIADEMGFNAITCESLIEAVKRCLDFSPDKPIRILICGSLYLAGDVLEANTQL